MWYSAHAIFYFESDGSDSFLVHENVYLIEADNDAQALDRAIILARENEDQNEDGHLELNDRPAKYIFSGIRKIIAVETTPETAAGKIFSGVEVTYSVMEVDSFEEVERLSEGEFVEVLYRE
jgi:hypothetical protein